jgi:hypothetical protein
MDFFYASFQVLVHSHVVKEINEERNCAFLFNAFYLSLNYQTKAITSLRWMHR